jgi:hypothetical protein
VAHPRIRLSRLREIGWRHWDPIGLGAEDEYDTYLLKAAGMVRRGSTDQEAIDYLVAIESEHIGLGVRDDTRTRAEATVKAIREYKTLWSDG